MLHKLKEKGNPHYQNLFSPEEFKVQCQRIDTTGYDMLYGSDDLIEDVGSQQPESTVVRDELEMNSSTESDETVESASL